DAPASGTDLSPSSRARCQLAVQIRTQKAAPATGTAMTRTLPLTPWALILSTAAFLGGCAPGRTSSGTGAGGSLGTGSGGSTSGSGGDTGSGGTAVGSGEGGSVTSGAGGTVGEQHDHLRLGVAV